MKNFRETITPDKGFERLIKKLSSRNSRQTKTFILAGAGAAQSDTLAQDLRLPLASSLRNQLLFAHYGDDDIGACLSAFQQESNIEDPTPDQVWQFLITKPDQMRAQAERLYKEFDPEKPIPPSYYMLARWFLSEDVAIGGIATTNFDLQFCRAFKDVARSLSRDGNAFDIGEMPQDFHYFDDCRRDASGVIQRLHGSLDRPWSIVAGAKANIHDFSGQLRDYFNSEDKNPFVILRKFLATVDPDNPTVAAESFFPYRYLCKTISQCSSIIVVGYSFQDKELAALFSEACRGKQVYVIEPHPSPQLCTRVPELAEGTLVTATAEHFLDCYVRALQSDKQLIQLPHRERSLVRDGPTHIPGYQPKRQLTRPAFSDPTGFLDPIYGTFSFSDELADKIVQLVDTGEVQRLRQIKQLSFVNLLYHGATHDRFSHSLGVAHLADKLMTYWRGPGMSASPRKLSAGDHLAFVASALIHDIGHGPLGHTMDVVRARLKEEQGHEQDTGRIFHQIFTDKAFADMDLALRRLEVAPDKVYAMLGQKGTEVDILHAVLDNDGCDIDRLDFVMRDTASALMCWGKSDPEVEEKFRTLVSNYELLLQGMRVVGKEGELLVAFDSNVRPLLEAFATLYLRLYRDVYYCWQNMSARAMLAEAVLETVRSRKIEFADIKPLTDVELLALLEDFENPKVAELAYLVKYRRLFRLCGQGSLSDDLIHESDEAVARRACNVSDYSDQMLVVRLPGKKVEVNLVSFAATPNLGTGEMFPDAVNTVKLGENNPIAMVFGPPI